MFDLSGPDYIISAFKQGSFIQTVENEPGKEVLGRLMRNGKLVRRCVSPLKFSTLL
jgi:hypothetical protein